MQALRTRGFTTLHSSQTHSPMVVLVASFAGTDLLDSSSRRGGDGYFFIGRLRRGGSGSFTVTFRRGGDGYFLTGSLRVVRVVVTTSAFR